jgi:hypothetical protein
LRCITFDHAGDPSTLMAKAPDRWLLETPELGGAVDSASAQSSFGEGNPLEFPPFAASPYRRLRPRRF